MSETTPTDGNTTAVAATLPAAPPPIPLPPQVVAAPAGQTIIPTSATTGQTADSPATTPKKRGRPRKAPVPEGEAPPKRRRGRPRKSETEARIAAENAAAAAAGVTPGAAVPAATGETPKKKRGRPKKEPGAEGPPKKRGRPRKVREEGAEAIPKPVDTTPKKRGRPRKNPLPPSPAPGQQAPAQPGQVPAPVAVVTTTTITSAPVEVPVAAAVIAPIVPNGGAAPAPATVPAPAPIETKESDAVSEPRMESRKRRRASKSPAREKKGSTSKKTGSSSKKEKSSTKKEPARKKLKGKSSKAKKEEEEEKEEKKAIELDFDHLDRYSLKELQDYAQEQKINMKLYGTRGLSKANYIYAILYKQLSALPFDKLKSQVKKRGVDMEEYGTRKANYIQALIDNRMGKGGEPLWELWKDIYLVGTEWDNYDSVFDVDWDFDHLKEALDEDGELYKAGSKHAVYLFGVTERTLHTPLGASHN
jgi:hypothetical protein